MKFKYFKNHLKLVVIGCRNKVSFHILSRTYRHRIFLTKINLQIKLSGTL